MSLIQDPKDEGYIPITLEAHDLVFGDRQASYGHPLDDFTCTAAMWTAYLQHKGVLMPDAEIEAEDFGPMMILAKVSRQANSKKRDNMTDTAGYAETTERVIFERARRDQQQADFIQACKETLNSGLAEAEKQIARSLGVSAEAAAAAKEAGVQFTPHPVWGNNPLWKKEPELIAQARHQGEKL